MDDALADLTLVGVLELIDRWGELYNSCWGKRAPYQEHPELRPKVDALIDEVRTRTRLAHDVVVAMGETSIAGRIVEHEEACTEAAIPSRKRA